MIFLWLWLYYFSPGHHLDDFWLIFAKENNLYLLIVTFLHINATSYSEKEAIPDVRHDHLLLVVPFDDRHRQEFRFELANVVVESMQLFTMVENEYWLLIALQWVFLHVI